MRRGGRGSELVSVMSARSQISEMYGSATAARNAASFVTSTRSSPYFARCKVLEPVGKRYAPPSWVYAKAGFVMNIAPMDTARSGARRGVIADGMRVRRGGRLWGTYPIDRCYL